MAVVKKKDRATTDELDLLKSIIQENNMLYARVIHRLREQISLSRETIFDVVKKKSEVSSKNKDKDG